MKNKIDQYLDILNNFNSDSEGGLKQILEDNDLKEIHTIVSKTSDALTVTPEVNIDNEWIEFEKKNFSHMRNGYISMLSRFLSRNAAVIICAVASLAVVAASLGVKYSFDRKHKEEKTEKKAIVGQTGINIVDTSIVDDYIEVPGEQLLSNRTIVFKNQSLDKILSVIANHYNVKLNFNSDNSKNLCLYFQWDQSLPLEEIIAQLNNFEQVNTKLDNNVITIE